MSPLHSDGISEGWFTLVIPYARARRGRVLLLHQPGSEGDSGEQPEKQRSCSGCRPVGPLALCLHSEVSAHLLERDFDPPESQVPLNDLYRVSLGVDAQLRLSPHLSERVSDQLCQVDFSGDVRPQDHSSSCHSPMQTRSAS